MAGKILSLLALPLIVALHVAAGSAILSSTGVVERGVSRLFNEYFHGTLTLESVGLDIFSGFRFEGVSFTPPDRETPLFRARIIAININGPALFKGTITPQTVKIVDPIVYVEQNADGAFSFESLMETERLMALLAEKTGRAEREPLSLLVVNGLVELAGEGPIAAGLEPYFDQPGSTRIHVPMLHCVDSGQEEMRWWFDCQLNHGALGALQAEGHLDPLGLEDLEFELLGVDLSGKRFNSFASEALEEIVDFTGFEGTLTARLDLDRDGEGSYDNLLRFSGFSLYIEDFPLLLNGVNGRATYRGGRVVLEHAEATALGEHLEAGGWLRFEDSFAAQFTLSGENVPFGPELQHAVEAIGGGRDYRAFAPQGSTDFTYKGSITAADPVVRGDCYIWPKGRASASYEGYVDPITGLEDTFPYRIHDLDGEIVVYPDGVDIRGVKGYARPQPEEGDIAARLERGRVLISGTVVGGGEKAKTQISVRATDLHFDKKLFEALRKQDRTTMETAERLELNGRFNMDLTIKGSRGRPAVMSHVLDLQDVGLCFDLFPSPMSKLRGRVENDGAGLVTFENLRGFRDSDAQSGDVDSTRKNGEIALTGRLYKGEVEEIVIQAMDQKIDEDFKSALSFFLGPGWHRLTDIDYEGGADFLVHINCEDGKFTSNTRADLHLDRMSGGLLPIPLEDIRGTMYIDPQLRMTEVHDLTLRAGNGRFDCSELKSVREGDIVHVDLKATGRHMGLDTEVTGYMDADILEEWSLLGCRGLVDLKSIDLNASFRNTGFLETLDAEAEFLLNGASVGEPVDISNLHGDLSLRVDLDRREERPDFLVRGHTKRILFELKDRLFTDVEADFRIDEESFDFNRFHGVFYGGTISGVGDPPMRLSMNPPYAFKGSIVSKGTELRYFLDRSVYAFRNLAGKVDLTMDFEGEGGNPHRTKASGKLLIVEGSLFELPLFAKLSRMMGSIFSTDPPTFSNAQATYSFQEGIITLTEMQLNSSLMELAGEGVMTMDGVDLYFIPSTGFVPTIPVLGDILNLIKNGILAFRASGPYSNIDVSYDTFVNRIFTDEGLPDEPRYVGRIEYTFDERF